MKLTISISDDLYEKWQERAKLEKLALSDWLLKRGVVFQDVNLTARHVCMHGEKLEELESLLDSPHLSSSSALLDAVRRRTAFSIEGLDLKLSQSELAELARRAERNTRSLEDELDFTIKRIKPLMFRNSIY